MTMSNLLNIQTIAIIVSCVISIVSIVIALSNYYQNKPKLKVIINDKNIDCFYGVKMEEEGHKIHYCVAGVYINILNNSPVDIGVSNAYLLLNKEKYIFIKNDIDYWKDTQFLYKKKDGTYDCIESYIPYDENGLSIPTRIGSYDTVSKYLLFHDFPNSIHNNCRAVLVLDTAIGKVKKRIVLHEIDEDYYENLDLREYERYQSSIVKDVDEYNG